MPAFHRYNSTTAQSRLPIFMPYTSVRADCSNNVPFSSLVEEISTKSLSSPQNFILGSNFPEFQNPLVSTHGNKCCHNEGSADQYISKDAARDSINSEWRKFKGKSRWGVQVHKWKHRKRGNHTAIIENDISQWLMNHFWRLKKHVQQIEKSHLAVTSQAAKFLCKGQKQPVV